MKDFETMDDLEKKIQFFIAKGDTQPTFNLFAVTVMENNHGNCFFIIKTTVVIFLK